MKFNLRKFLGRSAKTINNFNFDLNEVIYFLDNQKLVVNITRKKNNKILHSLK